MSPPVPRLTSNFGNADEAISTRTRCPAGSRTQVSHIGIVTSYTSPGVTGSARRKPLRYRSRTIPSHSRCANPPGCTSTSLAITSASAADVATCATTWTAPMISSGSSSGPLV